MVKNPPASAGDAGDVVRSLVRKIPWRRKWKSTSVFLPEGYHGQGSLVDYIQSMGCQRAGHY